MTNSFDNDTDEELTPYQCPHCLKNFEVAGNKWTMGDISCPFCGAEIDT